MRYLSIMMLFLLLAGCNAKEESSAGPQESGDMLSEPGMLSVMKPDEPENLLNGVVLERMDAGRYSYLRLATDSGEIWAAVPQSEIEIGEEVALADPIPMEDFESPTLNRTFDSILFAVLYEPGAEDITQTLMDAHSGVSDSQSLGPIDVEKAAGPEGRTVSEIFSQRQELKDQRVAVRGKVTKVNPDILDKNWIHIQDGTGDSQIQSNDLTITSMSSASIGDTVLVEGIVRTDKNYGMGYVFPVILEDATVTKE